MFGSGSPVRERKIVTSNTALPSTQKVCSMASHCAVECHVEFHVYK